MWLMIELLINENKQKYSLENKVNHSDFAGNKPPLSESPFTQW